MPARVLLLLLLLVLGAPGAAFAVSLFDFQWTSSSWFSTLIPVNRTNPDGSITPYDEVSRSAAMSGSGILALTPPSVEFAGYRFEFSGTGGSGGGRTYASGQISEGDITFPVSPDVPVSGGGPYSGGLLKLEGDPARPSGISISYFAGSSPHCMFNCSSVEFQGSGRVRTATVAASEPGALFVTGLILLGAAWLRRRR
jgi:MYXO-CTERM domain-containing protein